MLWLEWTATVVCLTAVGLTSLAKPKIMWIALLIFCIGDILWVWFGFYTGLWGLVVSNIGFLFFEIIALVRWYKYRQEK